MENIGFVGGFSAGFSTSAGTPEPTEPPVITLQPLNVTVDEGFPWNITSAASGAASSEWFKDAIPTGNLTNSIGGVGLAGESGTYFNRYTNIIGDTDTNDSVVNVVPDLPPQVMVHMDTSGSQTMTASSWSPNGDFTIRFKVAHSLNVDLGICEIGSFIVQMSLGNLIVYPRGTPLGSRTFSGLGIAIDELNEVELKGNTTSSVVTMSLNGVLKAGYGTPTGNSFLGAINLGTTQGGFKKFGGWLSDFSITDDDNPVQSFGWDINELTSNTEASNTTAAKTLNYNGIGAGAPDRETFTLNGAGTQWIGDNGTILTIGT